MAAAWFDFEVEGGLGLLGALGVGMGASWMAHGEGGSMLIGCICVAMAKSKYK